MSGEPTSPASPTSSVGSSGSFASAASTASTASTQTKTPITAKSQIVKKFARLFNELSKDDKKTYLDMLAYYIGEKINGRFKTIGNISQDSYRDDCYQSIFNNTLKKTGGTCMGALIPNTHIPLFFQGFAGFLDNFKFPPAKGTAQPELSLPMLDFVSELTSILDFRAATNDKDVRKYTFEMGMVDNNSFTKIQYIENASVDTTDIHDEADDRVLVNPNEHRDKLIEFLNKIHVLNQSQSLAYVKGDNPLVRFNLGFIQKPTGSDKVRPLVELDQEHVNLCFRLQHDVNANKILIILVINRKASSDGSRGCNFKIIEVLTSGVINKWTWNGKINDLKFYPTLVSASSGGRKHRRLSKTKKVCARSTRRRHNIKKLKQRSIYVKARNTKRKTRRFRH